MNAQMDAMPQANPSFMPQVPKTYQLEGDIAISLGICHSDFDGAKALLDLIVLLEPLNHVDLVISIAGGPEVFEEREWFDFHSKAVGFFRAVKINKVRDVRPMQLSTNGNIGRDWRPNNNMFRGVADYFQHFGKQYGAFYFLEPDCVILKRDWFSQLSAQYQVGRKPFMGVIRQAKNSQGQTLPQHMNGSGFYPNPVVEYSQALYAASMNQHPEAAPFDVAGGVTVTPLCQRTNLIYIDFSANPAINQEAVVWHGDKRNQMKYSMIEKFGGHVDQTLVRPHFPETLTSDLGAMAERVNGQLSVPPDNIPDDFLEEPLLQQNGQMTVLQNTLAAAQTPRITPPANAYEAYVRALNAFGLDRPSWARAVKEFLKTEKK